MTKPAIEVRDLHLSYGDNPVLKDVNLTVKEGDFFGIIGPNGGGKSTLLKAILGLEKPSRGEIQIFGEGPSTGRRHVGYVPQYAQFDRDFPISVWEVVLMGRLPSTGRGRWYTSRDRKMAEEALRRVDMHGLRNRQIDSLSGGQKQRVFIARALAGNPRILLLDEPTASIDRAMQESIYSLLGRLSEKVTIVLVTHDIGVVSTHINRVGCMNQRLIAHDDPTITPEMLEETYHCPVDIIAHGIPHRVFHEHDRIHLHEERGGR